MTWCKIHAVVFAGWKIMSLYSVSLENVPYVLAGCKSGNFSAKGNECAGIQRLQCEMNGKCSGTLQGKPYQINCNQKQECVTHKWGGALVRKFFSSVKPHQSIQWSNGCSWICEDTPSTLVRGENTGFNDAPGFNDALETALTNMVKNGYGKTKPLTISCVCSGNTCRSPICYHYLHKKLLEGPKPMKNIILTSSGTCTGTSDGRKPGAVTKESAFIVKESAMDSNVAANDPVYPDDKKKPQQNSVGVDGENKQFTPDDEKGTGIFFHRSQATDSKWLEAFTGPAKEGSLILAMDGQTVDRLKGRKACGKDKKTNIPMCNDHWKNCAVCKTATDKLTDCAGVTNTIMEPNIHLLNNNADVTDPYEPVTDPYSPADKNGNPVFACPEGKKNGVGNCEWPHGAYPYGLYDGTVRKLALGEAQGKSLVVTLTETYKDLHTALANYLGQSNTRTFTVPFSTATTYEPVLLDPAEDKVGCKAGRLTLTDLTEVPTQNNQIIYTKQDDGKNVIIKVVGDAASGLFKYLESYVERPDYYCNPDGTVPLVDDAELVFHHSMIKWAKYSAMAKVVTFAVDDLAQKLTTLGVV